MMVQPSKRAQQFPRRLGRYSLEKELASGGMATVYLGRSSGLAGFEKLVAIKCIHPHLAGQPSFVKMFLDEARLSARIQHPNVCHVFEVGQEEDTYFIAMEYLLGETLSSIARRVYFEDSLRHSMRFARLAALVTAGACRGLHAAHQLQSRTGEALRIVHRDATPANLFVTYDGHTKVVDFGVARAADQLHDTEPQTAKGKLAYMSPEQLRNRPIDHQTDVWGVGVSLWELCAQRRLFHRGSNAGAMKAILTDPIPAPLLGEKAAPPGLAQIIDRALQRDPEERYPSALAMGQQLEAFANDAGPPLGTEDVAALMHYLFQSEARQKRAFIAALPQMPEEPATLQGSAGEPIPTATQEDSGVVPTGSIRLPLRRLLPGLLLALTGLLVVVGVGAYVAAPGTWLDAAEGDENGDTSASNRPPSPPASPNAAVITGTEAPDPQEAHSPEAGPVNDPQGNDLPPAGPPSAAQIRAQFLRGRAEPARQTSQLYPVSVTTPGGWGEVRVSGRSYGRTPVRLQLPRGRHVVVVTSGTSGNTLRRVIRVPRTSRLQIALE